MMRFPRDPDPSTHDQGPAAPAEVLALRMKRARPRRARADLRGRGGRRLRAPVRRRARLPGLAAVLRHVRFPMPATMRAPGRRWRIASSPARSASCCSPCSWSPGARASRARSRRAIAALVVFQATLGMWTVTLLLKPAIVTAHLLGGMTLLALLVWFCLCSGCIMSPRREARALRAPAALALAAVAAQIALGGWVSANYAALACPDLPLCRRAGRAADGFRQCLPHGARARTHGRGRAAAAARR